MSEEKRSFASSSRVFASISDSLLSCIRVCIFEPKRKLFNSFLVFDALHRNIFTFLKMNKTTLWFLK